MSSGHDDHGHGNQSRFIQHHYDDAQHQFDSGKFGIWLFLAQEVLFFSALFVAYILYRVHHPEIYSYAHKWLDVKYGAINTAVLIFSSLTAAWAVRAAQLSQRKLLIGCLFTTILCACTFLGIKYIEYSHKIHEHILFGRYFDPCISPGGEELLTKGNMCAGTKGSVTWDSGADKAADGCYDVDKLDLDQRLAGVQADCDVEELKLQAYMAPVFKASQAHDCTATKTPFVSIEGDGGTYTFTGECDTIIVVGKGNKVTIDKAKHITVDGPSNVVTANTADAVEISKEKTAPASTVTVPAQQVTDPKTGATTTKTTPIKPLDAKAVAAQGRKVRELSRRQIVPQCPDELLLVLNANHGEAGASKEAEREIAPKFPCWRPAYQPVVCPDTATPEQHRHGAATKAQTGILVEYGDKEERESVPAKDVGEGLKIVATCKDAAAKPASDPLAIAHAQKSEALGDKAIHPVHVPSIHEEHEIESLGPPPEHTSMFFTIYFAMTGLHGVHVLLGIFVFIWLLVRAIKGHFTPDYFGPVDFAALYWHIVDLIWIFLFPLLYLIH